ncbi:fructokinase, partial [Thraustotheca clavata]
LVQEGFLSADTGPLIKNVILHEWLARTVNESEVLTIIDALIAKEWIHSSSVSSETNESSYLIRMSPAEAEAHLKAPITEILPHAVKEEIFRECFPMVSNKGEKMFLKINDPRALLYATLGLNLIAKGECSIELGGTTWALAIAHDSPLNIVARTRIDTTTPEETFEKALAWLLSQTFDAIGIASFGPVDLNKQSATYGFITTTPKPHWANTDIVGKFKLAFPGIPVNFETDVNAPALFEAEFGGHGDVSTLCYITVGTGIGVGVCIEGKPVHGLMHPEAGHMLVPIAEEDLAIGFKGTCPYHGNCAEGMAASGAIAARMSKERRELQNLSDDDPVWNTVAYYLALVCVNLTLTVSPQVIVIGGGISKRNGLFEKIHTAFEKALNGYVKTPDMKKYIRPSFHSDIGLVSSLELARIAMS